MNKNFTTLILLVLGCCIHSQAQTVTQLGFFAPLISTFEGKYVNDHLLIAQQAMKVMDVSDPANPTISGTASYPGSYAYQIAVQGNYAYMAEGGGGTFAVYDISNVNAPAFTGSFDIPATSFMTGGDLVLDGNTAYMTGFDTLYVIDVSNPSAPALLNTVFILNAGFQGGGEMVVHNNTLYMMTPISINIYDISIPSNPVYVTNIVHTHGYNQGLSLDSVQNRLFSTWKSSLQTDLGYNCFDLTQPQNPQLMFSDSTGSGSGDFGISAYRDNVLLITSGGSIRVFNVASAAVHSFMTSFSGQSVANSSVELEIRDSVFYNIKRGGVEVLKLSPWPSITTAVQDAENISEFNIYPNPATDHLGIDLNLRSVESVALTISDVNGKIVFVNNESKFTSGVHSIQIPLKHLTPGIYNLSLTGTGTLITKRFTVIR